MKGLSLWQPHATFMRDGDKEIETRSWGTPYRGDVAICSSKTPRANVAEAYDLLRRAGRTGTCRPVLWEPYPLGVVLCLVELVDCFRVLDRAPLCDVDVDSGLIPLIVDSGHRTPRHRVAVEKKEFVLGDLASDPPAWRWGWVTRNRRPLATPIQIRGAQGLFALSEEVESAIMAAVNVREAARV